MLTIIAPHIYEEIIPKLSNRKKTEEKKNSINLYVPFGENGSPHFPIFCELLRLLAKYNSLMRWRQNEYYPKMGIINSRSRDP